MTSDRPTADTMWFAGTPAERRVDRLWRCTRCGYFAYSQPYFAIYDEDGKEVGGGLHDCPDCGDNDWHWCGGDDREKRIGYAAKLGILPHPADA